MSSLPKRPFLTSSAYFSFVETIALTVNTVHARFRLLPETLFLCENIIDRFLSAQVVSLAKLQLVGMTCLLVASKVEKIVAPSVSHFLHCADSSYTEFEILLGSVTS